MLAWVSKCESVGLHVRSMEQDGGVCRISVRVVFGCFAKVVIDWSESNSVPEYSVVSKFEILSTKAGILRR